jgi:tRNA A37 threonylcarbamoyltransferase TsaD
VYRPTPVCGAFEEYSRRYGWKIHIPKFAYTTDNAAMVAISGYYKYLDSQFVRGCGALRQSIDMIMKMNKKFGN